MRRNKPDGNERHPWKCEVTEGDSGVEETVVNGWYTQVYEPVYQSQG